MTRLVNSEKETLPLVDAHYLKDEEFGVIPKMPRMMDA